MNRRKKAKPPVLLGVESFILGCALLLLIDALIITFVTKGDTWPSAFVLVVTLILGWMLTINTPIGYSYALRGPNGLIQGWNTKSGSLAMVPPFFGPIDAFPIPVTDRPLHLDMTANAKGTTELSQPNAVNPALARIESIVPLKIEGPAIIRTVDASKVVMVNGNTVEEKIQNVDNQIIAKLEGFSRVTIGSQFYTNLIKPDNHHAKEDVTDVICVGIQHDLSGYSNGDMVWAEFGQEFVLVDIEKISLAQASFEERLLNIERETVDRITEEMNNASRVSQADTWTQKGMNITEASKVVRSMVQEIQTKEQIYTLHLGQPEELNRLAERLAQTANTSNLGREAIESIARMVLEGIRRNPNP